MRVNKLLLSPFENKMGSFGFDTKLKENISLKLNHKFQVPTPIQPNIEKTAYSAKKKELNELFIMCLH